MTINKSDEGKTMILIYFVPREAYNTGRANSFVLLFRGCGVSLMITFERSGRRLLWHTYNIPRTIYCQVYVIEMLCD